MKKVLFILLAVVLVPMFVYAAGSSVTCTASDTGIKQAVVVTCAAVGDDSDGSMPNAQINYSGCLINVTTIPGATGPTANYDIVLNSKYGIDVTEGALANRHTSNAEEVEFLPAECYDGMLTMVISNTSVNDATLTIEILIGR